MKLRFFKATISYVLALTALSAAFWGCETRDDRSDCMVEMVFRFEYVQNKDRADLFAQTAETVDLYIYDAGGDYFVEHVRATRQAGTLGDDNRVRVLLPHGNFTVVAWANLDGDTYECLYNCPLPEKRVAVRATGGTVSGTLPDKMHGKADILANNRESQSEILLSMIKNTNKVTVVLHTTGDQAPVNDDAFKVRVTGSNGAYKFDNTPAVSGPLEYIARYSRPAMERFEAEFDVLRLLEGDDMTLSISRNGTRTSTLPMDESLTEALLRHPNYNDDDDLDRFDDYVLEYRIDLSDGNAVTAVLIKIDEWDVVEQGGGL